MATERPTLSMAQRLTSSLFASSSRFITTTTPTTTTPTKPSRPASPSPSPSPSPGPEKMYKLFPKTDPLVDGDECLRDCDSCTRKYPARFSIDEEDELFGKVDGWDTHLLVATGKEDWVRDVADEEGSIMEAVGKGGVRPANGVRFLFLFFFSLCSIRSSVPPFDCVEPPS